MKILITGITGYVGRHLGALWATNSMIELHGTARNEGKNIHLPFNVKYHPLEITDEQQVYQLLENIRPDIVIHSAAMSKPNDCELDKPTCYNINVKATEYIAAACKAINSRLIFMSTDMVFGDDGPYSETDDTCPVNYYGESKVLAENIIIKAGINYAIVRTVLVYGGVLTGQRPTFLQWVYNNLAEQKTIQVFTDQYRTACFINDLCSGIDALVKTGEEGVFHICGEQTYTPYEIAIEVAKCNGFNIGLIQPATSLHLQEAARRPQRCTLYITKAKQLLDYRPTRLNDALQLVYPNNN